MQPKTPKKIRRESRFAKTRARAKKWGIIPRREEIKKASKNIDL